MRERTGVKYASLADFHHPAGDPGLQRRCNYPPRGPYLPSGPRAGPVWFREPTVPATTRPAQKQSAQALGTGTVLSPMSRCHGHCAASPSIVGDEIHKETTRI